jgi:LPPG:FO 2-phospho-L-lactate transferase
VSPGEDLTVIVNVADDVVIHGLRVSPTPIPSPTGSAMPSTVNGDGPRRDVWTTEELVAFGAPDAWSGWRSDLANIRRTRPSPPASRCRGHRRAPNGSAWARGCSCERRSDRDETSVPPRDGEPLDLHFQEYWVRRRAVDAVKATRIRRRRCRTAGARRAALADADAVAFCPSNPVVSSTSAVRRRCGAARRTGPSGQRDRRRRPVAGWPTS